MRFIEQFFEWVLWNARIVVVLAVVSSLAASFAIFIITTIDIFHLVLKLLPYAGAGAEARSGLHNHAIREVVQMIDGFLVATVLLIFAMGLYELFISHIDPADQATSSRILSIHTLDDLKSKLAKVIMMILIVKFFDAGSRMKFANATELLAFAGGIALLGMALYFTHASENNRARAKGLFGSREHKDDS